MINRDTVFKASDRGVCPPISDARDQRLYARLLCTIPQGGGPIAAITVYNGELYVAAGQNVYVYDMGPPSAR